jgi:hypothetical protein
LILKSCTNHYPLFDMLELFAASLFAQLWYRARNNGEGTPLSELANLMTLGSGSIVFIDASGMICRKTSVGKGVLRAAAFASSSASVFLFLSIYFTVKHLKFFSILPTKARYFLRVGFLAMHSFSICPATTFEPVRRMHV